MSAYEIIELWRYPIKSMGGERVEVAEFGPGGIVGDRQWALRSAETGLIVSAKRPRRYGQLLNWSARTESDAVVATSPDGEAFAAGSAELDAALSAALGEQVSLVRVEPGVQETYDSEWPEIPGTALSDTEIELPIAMMTESTSFVDLAALHIVVAESMEHLGTLVGDATIGVERFRPSMVLSSTDGTGAGTFVDLEWNDRAAHVGGAALLVTNAAPRCIMTTLAQGDYGPARSILSTLSSSARKDLGVGTFACFGTYAEVVDGGAVSVGDAFGFRDVEPPRSD